MSEPTLLAESIFPSLTVRESVLGAVNAHRHWHAKLGRRFPLAEAQGAADEVMELVGLQGRADTPCRYLSHGDQKLLDIALALAKRCLVMDRGRVVSLWPNLRGSLAVYRFDKGTAP